MLQISNVKRIGLSPRVGRVGLPMDAPSKAANLNCSTYYFKTYGEGTLSQSHAWYFTDSTFHKDLAITLRGAIDRHVIPTRTNGDGMTQTLLGP